jgi:hypothetical protein
MTEPQLSWTSIKPGLFSVEEYLYIAFLITSTSEIFVFASWTVWLSDYPLVCFFPWLTYYMHAVLFSFFSKWRLRPPGYALKRCIPLFRFSSTKICYEHTSHNPKPSLISYKPDNEWRNMSSQSYALKTHTTPHKQITMTSPSHPMGKQEHTSNLLDPRRAPHALAS